MSETFYDTIRREIGRELGLSRDPTTWSANTVSDVDDIIQSGYRKALFPPILPGERTSHQWNFLNPIGTMQLQSGVDDYLMPYDFAGLIGDFTFFGDNNSLVSSVAFVSESEIRKMRSHDKGTQLAQYPRYVAIRQDRQSGMTQQTQWAMFWPTPDAMYTVQYQYYTNPGKLDANNPTPPGGSDQVELFRSAILSEVELFLEDMQGVRYSNFLNQLQAAVSRDRTTSAPARLGYNGNGECYDTDFHGVRVYYEKYPLE